PHSFPPRRSSDLQKTIGFNGRYPGKGVSAGFSVSVIVSPTCVSPTVLIDAVKYPTSPTTSLSLLSGLGVKTPISFTSNSFPVAINLILSPTLREPSLIHTYAITPR